MSQTNSVFIVTLCIIFVGYFLKRFKFLQDTDGRVISRFLMHTTFPALMLLSTSRIHLEPSLLAIPFLCIAFGSLMTLIAWFAFAKYPNPMRGVLTMGAGGLNLGLFAFPLIEGIWGRDGLVYAIMFDLGNTAIVFGLVYPIGAYFAGKGQGTVDRGAIIKKIISLPPLQASIIGLTLNALSIHLPAIGVDILEILAKANKPLVLLLMGMYMSFELDRSQIVSAGKVLLIRYACGFAAILLVMGVVREASLFRNVILVCFVLPVGITLLPFSDEYQFDSKIAGALVNISLVISFGLLWGLVVGLRLG